MRSSPRPHFCAWLLLCCLATCLAMPATAGTINLISMTPGDDPGNGDTQFPRMSSDGRYVVFASVASDLVVDDDNPSWDIYVRDRVHYYTSIVSVSSAGVRANSFCWSPAISGDGRYVAFSSSATNLVPNDTNTCEDVFLHDRTTGETKRVSLTSTAAQANGGSEMVSMSANGRYLVYDSYATNIVSGDTNNYKDVFLYDTVANTTKRISMLGATQGNGESLCPTISADGRYVVFLSSASNLVAGDTNGAVDVFRCDTTNGNIIRVNVSTTGMQGNLGCEGAAINEAGTHVIFSSSASNLVANDTNNLTDVFVRNITTATTVCISANDGVVGNNVSEMNSLAALSADGRYAVFNSYATNLIGNDFNGESDVFLRDLTAGTTTCITINSNGQQGNGGANVYAINANGRHVAFCTSANNFIDEDTNYCSDLFVNTVKNTPPVAVANNYALAPNTSLTINAPGVLADDTDADGDMLACHAETQPAHGMLTLNVDGSLTYTPNPGFIGEDSVDYFAWDGTEISTLVSLSFRVAGPLTKVMLTAAPASPSVAKKPITLTATPTGGRTLEYRFRAGLKDAAGVLRWTELSSPLYQAAPTCPWTPPTAGSYTLVVYVREVGSTATYEQYQAIIYTVTPALSAVALTADPPGCLPGQFVTLTVSPTGGGQLEYRFRAGLKDTTGVLRWTEVSDPLYQSARDCLWLPDKAGSYTLAVYAREQGSTAAYEQYAARTYTVAGAPPLTAVSLALSPSTPQATGQPVTLTATATGGGTVEYRFRVGQPDATGKWGWQELTSPSYQSNRVATWMPARPGSYTLVVMARNQGSTATYDVFDAKNLTVVSTALSAVYLAVSPGEGRAGQPVQLVATPTGGVNLEYRFRAGYVEANQWRWTELATPLYQAANTCPWVPTVGRTYTLAVLTRETGSSKMYEVYDAVNYTVAGTLVTARVKNEANDLLVDLPWAAFQDGDGAWVPATHVSTGIYTGVVTNPAGRYGFASVYVDMYGDYQLSANHATVAESTFIPINSYAIDASATGRLHGAVSGLPVGKYAEVNLPPYYSSSVSGYDPTYSLYMCPGIYDLYASRRADDDSIDKAIIKRGVSVQGDTVLDLNFNGSEAFTLAGSYTVTFTGGEAYGDVSIETGGMDGNMLRLSSGAQSAVTSFTYQALPAGKLAANDGYNVEAECFNGTNGVYRNLYFKTPGNKTVNLAYPAWSPTMTTTITTPYTRPTLTWTPYANARFYGQDYSSYNPNTQKWTYTWVMMTAGWANGKTSYTLPDFSTVPGWNSTWGLREIMYADSEVTLFNCGFGDLVDAAYASGRFIDGLEGTTLYKELIDSQPTPRAAVTQAAPNAPQPPKRAPRKPWSFVRH